MFDPGAVGETLNSSSRLVKNEKKKKTFVRRMVNAVFQCLWLRELLANYSQFSLSA